MPLTTDFEFDVFLSYNSQDKAVVRDIAERLRAAVGRDSALHPPS